MSLREFVRAEHGSGALSKSAVGLRDGEDIFRHFLEGKGYGTVLEIGTYKGISAACMAQYCKKVITIDLAEGQLESAGVSFDRWGFWESVGAQNIELHLVRDNKEKAELIRRLDFDFAFVDGAHDATVRDDFEMVKKCGAVLLHDYAERPGKENHVKKFVDTLGPVEVVDIFAMWRRAP